MTTATYLSARAMGIVAMDQLDQAAIDQGWAPPGTVVLLSAQLAQVGVPQATYDAMVVARDAAVTLATNRKTALTNVLTDLTSADTADVAEGAANTAGDIARAAARAKIAAEP